MVVHGKMRLELFHRRSAMVNWMCTPVLSRSHGEQLEASSVSSNTGVAGLQKTHGNTEPTFAPSIAAPASGWERTCLPVNPDAPFDWRATKLLAVRRSDLANSGDAHGESRRRR